ncbi:MAG: hypothetical protein AAFV86_21180 [Pseudomonadota bacterium]
MSTTSLTLAECRALHDGLAGAMRARAEAIAADLLTFDRRDTARIRSAVQAMDGDVRRFFAAVPQVMAAQAAAREAGAEAEGASPGRDSPDWARFIGAFGLTRVVVNRWQEVRALIERQAEVRRTALYRDWPAEGDPTATQLAQVSLLLDDLRGVLNPAQQDTDAHARGAFADIALPHADFLAHLHAAYRLRLAQDLAGPTWFVDVGCGGGLKVLAAGQVFDRALGIELDPGYAAAAGRLLDGSRQSNCMIVVEDALAFEHYGEFGVIYFYRPLRRREDLAALEARICEAAVPGTVLIVPYQAFAHRAEALGCTRVAPSLYLAGRTAEEAAVLADRAEQTGPAIKPPIPTLFDIFEPIVKASARRGHGLAL